jgi:anthranilate phosphoribosyltransferase
MAILLAGEATPAQTGAFLMGLRVKGETEDEVVGLVESMRAASVKISPGRDDLVDLCGTGGDGSGTFNISTAASLVVAGAGAAVAKHGNRSASSQCGSADVLEALGVPIDLPPDRVRLSIEENGFGFLFARAYHPAMKHVAPVRGELRIRTVFNFLGPLTSPAGVQRQLVGVSDDAFRPTLARVLERLGTQHAWVVHGEGGLDELTIAGATWVTEVGPRVNGKASLKELSIRPEDCGVQSGSLEALKGGDAATNAGIIEKILQGEPGLCREAVVLNAAAALFVSARAGDLREGAAMACDAIDSGSARKVLEALRRFR